MNGNDLKFLREGAHMSKVELSKLLDITLRTLVSWEEKGNKYTLGKPYVLASRVLFESKLLKNKLRKIADEAYKIAPSRYISVWLICSHELMLMRDVALHADFQEKNKFTNDEIRKNIREKSLFVYPMKYNEVINETKKSINKHPGKGKAENNTHYFKDCVFARNILLIPHFCETETDIGTRPAVLLVLEDKIKDAMTYNQEKVNKLKTLIRKGYTNGIECVCKALDYYSPLYCDYKV